MAETRPTSRSTSNGVPNRAHEHVGGVIGWIGNVMHLPGFAHEHGETESVVVDRAVLDNNIGIITLWVSLGLLWLTTVFQGVIYYFSGSVALLGDTAHNFVDALNSLPLLFAFYLARRPATRRYTYGFGRAEDVAGIFIILSIIYSAGHILLESINRFFNPFPLENLPLVAVAALVGFVGNEAVATLQIRVGKRIGSDAMVADGQHARIDGITSLAVLIAVGGVALGIDILDPIIGVLIAVAIIGIAWHAIRKVWFRLMDAVDPAIVSQIEHFSSEVEGVLAVAKLRVRWVGHRLFAEVTVVVDENRSLAEIDMITQQVVHVLHDALPAMGEVTVHVEPNYKHGIESEAAAVGGTTLNLLPQRYQISTPSAAPMGAAALKYDTDGNAAWNEIWTDFCDLALAGGPPHRGSLLEPVSAEVVASDPEGYARVIAEMERGLKMVTGLPVRRDDMPGWIGVECDSEAMALWLLRAIVVENISVRREGQVLYFPAGPHFRLEKEIKNVVTVVAKTNHYWQEHLRAS
ncbi:MAG: cation transporter [Chloroflexi bacterium]|nr:cation transporter [Chloroflexota bacterium]